MKLLINYATLVRLPNLIIVILTEWLLYQYVLIPAYKQAKIAPTLNGSQIFLLAIVTAFITAGGYIINDIMDYKIDLVNRPNKVIIAKKISLQVAYLLYFTVNVFGFILAIYLALKTKNLHLMFLYPLALLGLYLYSASLKRLLAVDNIVVSLYCAGVAIIVAVAERHSIRTLLTDHYEIGQYPIFIFLMYILFAFLTTLIREIIKDMEDIQGDRKLGCNSLPIALGIVNTKILIFIFGGILISTLLYALYYLRDFLGPAKYIFLILGIIIPIVFELYQIAKAQDSQDYHKVSTLAKVTMLAGIFFIVITSL